MLNAGSRTGMHYTGATQPMMIWVPEIQVERRSQHITTGQRDPYRHVGRLSWLLHTLLCAQHYFTSYVHDHRFARHNNINTKHDSHQRTKTTSQSNAWYMQELRQSPLLVGAG